MKRTITILIIVILVVLGVVLFRNQDSPDIQSGPAGTIGQDGQPLSDEQVEDIVARVSKHIKLPDETPNVGIVTDIETLLSTQPFYEGAENGDILLIYPSISRAILFDLDEDLIINVGPVVFENPEGGPEVVE